MYSRIHQWRNLDLDFSLVEDIDYYFNLCTYYSFLRFSASSLIIVCWDFPFLLGLIYVVFISGNFSILPRLSNLLACSYSQFYLAILFCFLKINSDIPIFRTFLFVGFSTSSDIQISHQQVYSSCCFMPTSSKQHNVINVMEQGYVVWNERGSKSCRLFMQQAGNLMWPWDRIVNKYS